MTTEGGNFEENDSWHIHFWCSVDDGSIGASESGHACSRSYSESIRVGTGASRYACSSPNSEGSLISTLIA